MQAKERVFFMQIFKSTNEIVLQVLYAMKDILNDLQIAQLKMSMETALYQCKVYKEECSISTELNDNEHVLKMFVASKTVGGRGKDTLRNYCSDIVKMFNFLQKDYRDITTDDIKMFMYHRQKEGNLKNSSLDNIRRYLSSFFKFLTIEEYINKNPMLRIDSIKAEEVVRTTITSEENELIRCNCTRERDLAIVDLLQSSGIRVGELVKLNRKDIDLNKKEFIVFGKGSKERQVFISGKAVVHLQKYLESRTDNNPALFVSVNKPFNRLSKSGIRYILKTIIARDEKTKDIHLHPHAYRYTFGTELINKGAPLEHVTEMLGHVNSDTTRKCYAKLQRDTVRQSHKKYID